MNSIIKEITKTSTRKISTTVVGVLIGALIFFGQATYGDFKILQEKVNEIPKEYVGKEDYREEQKKICDKIDGVKEDLKREQERIKDKLDEMDRWLREKLK